jgi:DNA-binding Xre family transcriptional regulator
VLRDVTQQELSKKTGIDNTQLAHFEKGNRKPSMDNLRKLCEGLNVSADYLLGIVEFPYVTQDTVLSKWMSALSDRDFETIMNLLRFFNRPKEGEG